MQNNTKHPSGKSFFDHAALHRAVMAGVGMGGAGGASPAGPPASIRLEPSDSNLNSAPWLDGPELVGFAAVVPCKCRCRTCTKCGPQLGWRVRQNLLGKADRFRSPAMLSLTLDRSHFESPEQAHKAVTDKSYIARLMRLLGVKHWISVLEFQTKTGQGWPHWHLLIDLADVKGRLDLQRAWHLWRDKWGLGGLDLSAPRSFSNREHAVLYITKYLTKMPEAFPTWVMLRQRSIRFINGCKALGSLTGQRSRVSKVKPVDQMNLPFRSPVKVLLERMAKCEMVSNVFGVYGNNLTGEGSWRWIGTVPCSPNDLAELSNQGTVSAEVASVAWGEKELLIICENSDETTLATIDRLSDELESREVGYKVDWERRIYDRAMSILDHHVGFWAAKAA
jgi:hypothetical protein